MKSPLRVLHLEDNFRDTELAGATLQAEGIEAELTRVETEQAFVAALQQGSFDLILADYTLPSFDGLSTLTIAQQQLLNVPFIFVSGTLGEDVAIEALKRGATDYVLKTRLARLAPAITRALREAQDKEERKRAEAALRHSEEQWKATFESNPTMYFMLDAEGTILSVNTFGAEQLAYKQAELVGQPVLDIFYPPDRAQVQQHAARCLQNIGQTMRWEARKVRKDGTIIWVRETGTALLLRNKPVLLVVCEDITDRKRAEEAVRRSEKELRDLIETMPTMAFATAPNGSSEFATRSWLEYTGLSREEAKGAGWVTTIHPNDLDQHVSKWRASMASGEPFENELRHRSASGNYRWFLVRAVSLRDEKGQILKWYGTLTDIEDRKRAEEALQRSEAYLSEAQKLTLTGSWAWDPQADKILYCSDELFRIYEVERQETLPSIENFVERVHPDDRARIRERSLDQVSERAVKGADYRLLLPDGRIKHVRSIRQPIRNGAGEVVEVLGTVVDITERKKAEEALQISEQKYRDLINASPDAICVIDPEGKLILVNPAAVELTGCAKEDLIGSSIVETYVPEERHLLQQRIELLKAGRPLRFERKFARKNGEIVPVEVSWSVLRGQYYQAIIRDISERKRREALLAGEKRVLEMVAKSDPLPAILDRLCLLVEGQAPGVLASILLIDATGKQLRHGGAPSLPRSYIEAIDGARIGPSAGSCGTAAYRREQVIVSDIVNDPLWAEFREAALAHSLRACWSTPIFSSEGKVIGTFAMYYQEPRSPTRREQEAIQHITHLAGIAIERKLAEKARQQSEAYLAEAQRLSHTGSWAWTPATGDIRYWSDETFRVLGFDPHDGTPRFETFVQRLHADDQTRIRQVFDAAVRDKTDLETDYRIVHPSGEVRSVHVVVHPVCDESGNLAEFVGTVIDVTETKRAEEALRASEQVARGQVEALTYSLDVLATAPAPDKFIGEMLSTIGRMLDAQSVIMWLRDEESDKLLFRAAAEGTKFATSDPSHPFVKDPLLWKHDAMLVEKVFKGVPVICEDIETEPLVSAPTRKYFKAKGTKKCLTIPTAVGGKIRGFINIRHATRPPYRPEEVELAKALAHQAMLAIQLTELAEQSRTAAILAERNRMARDIHDTLAQGFTGVIVQLEAAADAISSDDDDEAERYVSRASELARRSLNEARRSVHALRPEALQHANFWDALKGIIKNTTAGSPVTVRTKLKGKVPVLPPDWEENLMHIGQEALTNTLKYAHAGQFETQLTCDASELRLQFQDDGDGFVIDEGHDGFGLAGMRERVTQMGGELEVSSARGKGTKISVVLPLNGGSSS